MALALWPRSNGRRGRERRRSKSHASQHMGRRIAGALGVSEGAFMVPRRLSVWGLSLAASWLNPGQPYQLEEVFFFSDGRFEASALAHEPAVLTMESTGYPRAGEDLAAEAGRSGPDGENEAPMFLPEAPK